MYRYSYTFSNSDLQLCILFAASFIFSLTELELRRHSQLFLFFSLSFNPTPWIFVLQWGATAQLCSCPVEGSLSFFFLCLTPTSQRSVRGERERERERERAQSGCVEFLGRHCNHYTSSYCSASVTVCGKGLLLTANGGLLLQKPRERKRGKKSERERKTRTKATTGWQEQTDCISLFKRKEEKRKALEYLFFSFVLFFSSFSSCAGRHIIFSFIRSLHHLPPDLFLHLYGV